MDYNSIKTDYLEGKISIDECEKLVESRLLKVEKILEVKERHIKMTRREALLSMAEKEQIRKEEIEIGYNQLKNADLSKVILEDAVTHCFLEGVYSPYDERYDLKTFLNSLRYEKNHKNLDTLFETLQLQKSTDVQKSQATKKEILDYIDDRIKELNVLKEKVLEL